MIKSLITFVFGNALWDMLVGCFGSPEAVVGAAVIILGALLVIYIIKKIIEVLISAYILILILSAILS